MASRPSSQASSRSAASSSAHTNQPVGGGKDDDPASGMPEAAARNSYDGLNQHLHASCSEHFSRGVSSGHSSRSSSVTAHGHQQQVDPMPTDLDTPAMLQQPHVMTQQRSQQRVTSSRSSVATSADTGKDAGAANFQAQTLHNVEAGSSSSSQGASCGHAAHSPAATVQPVDATAHSDCEVARTMGCQSSAKEQGHQLNGSSSSSSSHSHHHDEVLRAERPSHGSCRSLDRQDQAIAMLQHSSAMAAQIACHEPPAAESRAAAMPAAVQQHVMNSMMLDSGNAQQVTGSVGSSGHSFYRASSRSSRGSGSSGGGGGSARGAGQGAVAGLTRTRIDEDAALTNDDVITLQQPLAAEEVMFQRDALQSCTSIEVPDDVVISRRSSLAMHHRSVSEASGNVVVVAAAEHRWSQGSMDGECASDARQLSRGGSHNGAAQQGPSRQSPGQQRGDALCGVQTLDAGCQHVVTDAQGQVMVLATSIGCTAASVSMHQAVEVGDRHQQEQRTSSATGSTGEELQPLLHASNNEIEQCSVERSQPPSRTASQANSSASTKAAHSPASSRSGSAGVSRVVTRVASSASTESARMSSQQGVNTQQPHGMKGAAQSHMSHSPHSSYSTKLSHSTSRESDAARTLRQQLSRGSHANAALEPQHVYRDSQEGAGPQAVSRQPSQHDYREAAVPVAESRQLQPSISQVAPGQASSSHMSHHSSRGFTAAAETVSRQLSEFSERGSIAVGISNSQSHASDKTAADTMSRQVSMQQSRDGATLSAASRQLSTASGGNDAAVAAVAAEVAEMLLPQSNLPDASSPQQEEQQGSISRTQADPCRQLSHTSDHGIMANDSLCADLTWGQGSGATASADSEGRSSCHSGPENHTAASAVLKQLSQSSSRASTSQSGAHTFGRDAAVASAVYTLNQPTSCEPAAREVSSSHSLSQGGDRPMTMEEILGELLQQRSDERFEPEMPHSGEHPAAYPSWLRAGNDQQQPGAWPAMPSDSSATASYASAPAAAMPDAGAQQHSSAGGAKSGVSSSLGSGGTSHHLLPLLMQPGAACTMPDMPGPAAHHESTAAAELQLARGHGSQVRPLLHAHTHDQAEIPSTADAVSKQDTTACIATSSSPAYSSSAGLSVAHSSLVPAASNNAASCAITSGMNAASSGASEVHPQQAESLAHYLLDLLQCMQPPSPRSHHAVPSPVQRVTNPSASPSAVSTVRPTEQSAPATPAMAIGKLKLSAADSLQLKALAYLLQHKLGQADGSDAPAALAQLLLIQAGSEVPVQGQTASPAEGVPASGQPGGDAHGSITATAAPSPEPRAASSTHAGMLHNHGSSNTSSGVASELRSRQYANSHADLPAIADGTATMQQIGWPQASEQTRASASSHGGLTGGPSMSTMVSSHAAVLLTQSAASHAGSSQQLQDHRHWTTSDVSSDSVRLGPGPAQPGTDSRAPVALELPHNSGIASGSVRQFSGRARSAVTGSSSSCASGSSMQGREAAASSQASISRAASQHQSDNQLQDNNLQQESVTNVHSRHSTCTADSCPPVMHERQGSEQQQAQADNTLLTHPDVPQDGNADTMGQITPALVGVLEGALEAEAVGPLQQSSRLIGSRDGALYGPMQALLQQLQGLEDTPSKLASPFEVVHHSREHTRTKSSGSSHSTLGGTISSMLRQGNEGSLEQRLGSCQSDKLGSDTGSMEAKLAQALQPQDAGAVRKQQQGDGSQGNPGLRQPGGEPDNIMTNASGGVVSLHGDGQLEHLQHDKQLTGRATTDMPPTTAAAGLMSHKQPLVAVRSAPDKPVVSSLHHPGTCVTRQVGSAVTSPPLASRLSRSTSRNEPCPEGTGSPPSPHAVHAAVQLPVSAAALSAGTLTTAQSGSQAQALPTDASRPAVDLHAAPVASQASCGGAKEPTDAVRALLQQLRQTGHHVPAHAERVLSLIMHDVSCNSQGPAAVPGMHNPAVGMATKQLVSQASAPAAAQGGVWASAMPGLPGITEGDRPLSPSGNSSCSTEQGSVPSSSAVSWMPDAARRGTSSTSYDRVQQLLQQRLSQRAAGAVGKGMLGAAQMDLHALAAAQSLQRSSLLPVPEKRAVSHPLNSSEHMSAGRALASAASAGVGMQHEAPEVVGYMQQFVQQQQQQRGIFTAQSQPQQNPGAPRWQRIVEEDSTAKAWHAQGCAEAQPGNTMTEEDAASADVSCVESSDMAPAARPSLLQAWREITTSPISEQEVQQQALLQKALQPAPSSPGRAAEVQQAALASPSPLLPGAMRRPGSPARQTSQRVGRSAPAKQASMPVRRQGSSVSAASPPLAAERSQPMLGRSKSSKPTEPRRSKSVERPRGSGPSQQQLVQPVSLLPLSARAAFPVSAAAPVTAALPAGTKTPGGRPAQAGSILDAMDSKSSPVQPAVSVHRAFAWQERETRAWLASLGISISPEEEEASLLDNPVRNGVLLCELAAVLTRVPVRSALVPPLSLVDARANIMLGLDQLGLLHDMDLPPEAVGAALYPADAAATAAQQAGSASYSARLKARQAQAGCSILWEVEKLLGGRRDAMWGLLNHIREMAVNKQAFLNPATHKRSAKQAAARAAASMEARTEAFLAAEASIQRMLGMPNVPAATFLNAAATSTSLVVHKGRGVDPAPTAAAAAAAVLQKRPILYSPPHAGLREQEVLVLNGDTSSRRSPPTEDYGLTCMLASGVGPLHVHYGPRMLSPGRRDAMLRVSAQQKQEQQALEHATMQHMVLAEAAAAALQAAESPSPRGNRPEVGLHSATRVELGERPSWTSVRLPYNTQQLAALEASLLRWLLQMGAIDQDLAAQGFGALVSQMADGVFLCWLVQRITSMQMKGVNKKPLVVAHARANITRAIQMLRTVPNLSRRSLNHEEAILHAERSALTGLLEDLHRLADGMAPAGSVWQPGNKPYLPFAPDMSVVVPAAEPAPSIAQQLAGVRSSLTYSPLERRPRPASTPRPRPALITPPTAPTTSHDDLSPMSSPRYGEAAARDQFLNDSRVCEDDQTRPWSPPGISKLFVTPTKPGASARPASPVRAPQRVWSPPTAVAPRSLPGQPKGPQRDTMAADAYRKERRAAAGIAAAPRVVTAIATAQYPSSKSASPSGAGQDLDQYLLSHQHSSPQSAVSDTAWAGSLLRLSQQHP